LDALHEQKSEGIFFSIILPVFLFRNTIGMVLKGGSCDNGQIMKGDSGPLLINGTTSKDTDIDVSIGCPLSRPCLGDGFVILQGIWIALGILAQMTNANKIPRFGTFLPGFHDNTAIGQQMNSNLDSSGGFLPILLRGPITVDIATNTTDPRFAIDDFNSRFQPVFTIQSNANSGLIELTQSISGFHAKTTLGHDGFVSGDSGKQTGSIVLDENGIVIGFAPKILLGGGLHHQLTIVVDRPGTIAAFSFAVHQVVVAPTIGSTVPPQFRFVAKRIVADTHKTVHEDGKIV
jgi:hypothetical protein